MAEQSVDSGTARYSLALSDQERMRYRMMAAGAAANEAMEWASAGVASGARVADVGCGPGAVLRLLGERVGASGVAVGVDANADAVAMAREEVADLPHVDVRVGQADATNLDADSFDVVMCRHVLAHNGGGESAIVDHLASLVRPGGCVYLVDVDASAMRSTHGDADLHDLEERYRQFQRARGNDLSVGLRLGDLLTAAGLAVETYACRSAVLRSPRGMRPPPWAARDEMVAEGFATEDDVNRWSAAFTRLDALEPRPWFFAAAFVAVGRR